MTKLLALNQLIQPYIWNMNEPIDKRELKDVIRTFR